jgi:hypothetical protein
MVFVAGDTARRQLVTPGGGATMETPSVLDGLLLVTGAADGDLFLFALGWFHLVTGMTADTARRRTVVDLS